MKEKDKYFGLELLLTFCLLNISMFMLGESLSALRPYLIFGLIFGFCFSWFIRNKSPVIMNVIITIGAVLVCLGIVYSILNSSFFYRELILISIKGVFVLEIILVFGAHLPSFLSYVQVLNIPIFMGSPLFAEGYSIEFMLLAAAYIICYLAILRIKLYASVNTVERKNIKRDYSIFVGIILFLTSIVISWGLFNEFSFTRFTKAGLFPEEKITQESELAKLEKEYYDLQDKISHKFAKFATEFNLTQEARKLLNLFSILVNETLDTMEVDKAQQGLISQLSTIGPGLKKNESQELITLIKDFVDKKVILNLKINKDTISDLLKTNPFKLTEKISGLSMASKIQYSKTAQEIRESERRAESMIDSSPVDKEIKKQLKDSFKQLKEWKDYDIYRQKIESLEKQIESLQEPQYRVELTELTSQIQQAQDLSDFKEIEQQLQELKETAPEQLQEIVNEAQELLDLKQEMSILLKSKELKEKIEDLNLTRDRLQEVKQQIEEIKDSETVREFVKNSRELKAELKKEGAKVDEDLKKVWENKIDILFQQETVKAREALKENTLADSGEALLKELDKLKSQDSFSKLDSGAEKLQRKITELRSQGFISEQTKKALEKIIREIKQLVQFKIDNNIPIEAIPAEAEVSEEEPAVIPQELIVYRQKAKFLEEQIEALPDSRYKTELLESVSRIDQAQDLSDFKEIEQQLQELKETAPEQLQEIVNEAQELLDLKQEISVLLKSEELEKKLEDLNLDENMLQKIKQQIEEVKNSETVREFVENSRELKEELEKQGAEVDEDLKKIWENKMDILARQETVKAREALKENTLADSGEALLKELEKLKSQDSFSKLDSGAEKLQRKIDELRSQGFISEQTKNALKEIIGEIKQLVQFGIDNNIRMEAAETAAPEEKAAAPKERPSGIVPIPSAAEMSGLISIILSSENVELSMKDSVTLKAEGYYSDSSRKDITSLVNWKNDRPYIVRVKQGRVDPVWFGTAKIRAEYSQIQSLPATIKVIFTMAWLREILLKIILSIVSAAIIIFTILFFIIKIKKNRLRNYFRNNPKGFIINLYENFKRIMVIFGFGNKEHLPPLAYAKLIESLHSVEENILLKFTVKFEEAKYSNHMLQSDDALNSLNYYNGFLNTLSIRYNKFLWFYKYCLALIYRIPLIINIQ